MDEMDDLALEEEMEVERYDFSEIFTYLNVEAGIIIISAAVGICANLYVVCAASVSLKNNVVNAYVLQRALAHLVFLMCAPILASHIILRSWPFGDALCKMTAGFVHISGYADIVLMVAMCVDGHKAFDVYSIDTRLRDSKIAAAICWVIATIMGAPTFGLFGTLDGPEGASFCTVVGFSAIVSIITNGSLLLLVIAFLVSWALLPGMFPPQSAQRRELSDEALVARRLIVALVVSFSLINLPFVLPRLYSIVGGSFTTALFQALHLTAVLPYLSSAVDPIIYIVLRRSLASPLAATHTRGVEITYVNLMPEL
ncbi:somatostatin receptor type 3-like [Penaeus japonicus]|uniref:somatostatin receptor type 3-like n=1 Tax=Penaeus japonicus TaxID=27405 RepID=UPI001C7169F5|nr:somatostatin receptor type 3-like [Penaeus japonicus]